ncbi:hypothetical protein [Agrobacterium pusense]|uniref:hypothetical protein n=1 Tax=Agrobacterium pusense TaxID=648995 RepID=UPI0005132628|nr:hypothetical protein [Agrobacterium pusense]ANV26260.1 hypothetical protein BA939_20125 [Rhizobium sp. S41]KGE79877.1 hypothetical protein LW14_26505 [Rhizobium sp. H41]QWW73380.1 hypothetical protein KP800_11785 [Agrobacterium pusense]
MTTFTSMIPNGEVLRSSAAMASMFSHRSFGAGARNGIGEPAALRRHPHIVRFRDVEADLDLLIDRAIAAIVDGEPVEDEILGHYVHIASLVRAVSFREGKLLEQAVERLAKANPNITVLTQSLKLPLVKAALEAVSGNDWQSLDGIKLDCEAPAKGSYTPDLILVNRARHTAYILDLKRSLASYGDTSRLEELKLKMMASAMVLPDWLYKNHKRLMVDTVEVAIVDGASRPSDHASGIWALSEIDDLLEIDGVAACMAELRLRFGRRVQQLLQAEASKALGVMMVASASAVSGKSLIALNGPARSYEEEQAMAAPDEDDGHYDLGCFDDDQDDEPEPARIRVGFARRPRGH